MYESPSYPTSSPTLGIVSSLNFSFSGVCMVYFTVISMCIFWMTNDELLSYVHWSLRYL